MEQKKTKSFAELAQTLFPEEVAEFYEKNISLYALLRKIRKVNERLAFDIWRYLLLRGGVKEYQRRMDSSLVDVYEFRFEPQYEAMHLSALKRDEQFREVLFRKTFGINERQVWLLYLALKNGETDLFDTCMRLLRRNINRFRKRSSYTLDVLLLRVIDRLRGSTGESYFGREAYAHVIYFADMIALPRKRKRVYVEAKDALRFYLDQHLTEEERDRLIHERVLHAARQAKERRIRERDVKYPLWENDHTVVPYAIAGLRHYLSDLQITETLPLGTTLSLAHDRENRHDAIAVSLHLPDGMKVGYIGKPYNRAFCELLLQGENLSATVCEVERDATGLTTVWVTIFIER